MANLLERLNTTVHACARCTVLGYYGPARMQQGCLRSDLPRLPGLCHSSTP